MLYEQEPPGKISKARNPWREKAHTGLKQAKNVYSPKATEQRGEDHLHGHQHPVP